MRASAAPVAAVASSRATQTTATRGRKRRRSGWIEAGNVVSGIGDKLVGK